MTNRDRAEGDLVSVIVPALNAETWIGQAVASILSQSWPRIEVVVDDGSRDRTAEVVKAMSDQRVILVQQPNLGAASARNRGFATSRGGFIQFLDADDLLGAQKIERQMKALLRARPGAIASCVWRRFTTDPLDGVVKPEPVWEIRDCLAWVVASLTGGGMMQPGAWLTPRSLIQLAGPWDESLSLHDDGEFFTRVLLRASENVFVPEATVFYREVGGSLSRRRSRAAMESALAVCRSRHKHLLEVRDDRPARRALATQYAQFAYEFGLAAPDLSRQALDAMRGLRTSPAPVAGGRAFRCLARGLGMAGALRIRSFFQTTSR